MNRIRKGGIRACLSVVALFFLGQYLLRNWSQVPPLDWERLAPALLAGLVSFTLLRLYLAALWGRVLSALGGELPAGVALRIHTRALTARYIPGNVWHAVSIAAWCAQEGIGPGTTTAAWLLENAYTVLGGAFAALVALSCGPSAGISVPRASLLLPFVIGMLVLHPRVLRGLLRIPLRLLRKPAAEIPVSTAQSLRFVLLYAGMFVGQGLTFYYLIRAVCNHAPTPFAVIGIFAAAWVGGYLSFLTPSGLGVREAVMTLMLSRMMPQAEAALLPLLLRVLMTAAELIAAALPFGRTAGAAPVAFRRALKTDVRE